MNDSQDKPLDSALRASDLSEGRRIWVLTANAELRERIRALLAPLTHRIETMLPAELGQGDGLQLQGSQPALVILDIGREVSEGTRAMQAIKRLRIHAPLVVLTEEFSKDFGAEIISRGVRYYFSHDFVQDEFIQVVKSLLEKRERRLEA